MQGHWPRQTHAKLSGMLVDTRCVCRTGLIIAWVLMVCLRFAVEGQSLQTPPAGWQSAVRSAARSAPEARILVLEIATGRLLASSHLAEAARTLATPGSAFKPLVLYGLVSNGRWDPALRIACSRKLSIGGHSVNCSHPPAAPMDAREALSWSCNTYFATVAGTLVPGELRRLLDSTGLLSSTGLAINETTAAFRDLRTPDETRLALLGVEGVKVTPLEMATAYRWLALQFDSHPNSAATKTLRAALEDSASVGTARAVAQGGVPVAGKTGTASSGTGGGQSHGWFIGLAPSDAPIAVIAVYLPAGHGSDAAHVAAELLARSPLRHR